MSTAHKLVKQLVILSGKGGTGKTCLTAALMHLSSQSKTNCVFVDADVDAANLALATFICREETHRFYGSKLAFIDEAKCNRCGACFDICRFDAIRKPSSDHIAYQVIELLCDGCAACVHACPESAIHLETQQDGEWYHSTSPYGHLFHAELFPGEENSGKLVTTVKQHAKLYAEDHGLALMIVDGPPGIGCPVISASAGADLVLLVAEPGVSGIHDLERILETLDHFKIPVLICINKADIHAEGTKAIHDLAQSCGLKVAGTIPFDHAVPQSMAQAQPVTLFNPKSQASLAIIKIWQEIQCVLFEGSVNP